MAKLKRQVDGRNWVVNEYITKHAVRKSDVAKAQCGDRKLKRHLKTGVKGRGRYKSWTPQAMLRAAFPGLA